MMKKKSKYRHVGVAQFYPWRPHAAQRDFLLQTAAAYGTETSELVCNGSLTKCYDKQFQTLGWGSIDHCIKCRVGGGRNSVTNSYFFLDWSTKNIPVDGEEIAMLSNRAALVRAELDEDITIGKDADGVLFSYRVAYHSTLQWIERFGIDLILLFNGRIDLLKGVMDAAAHAGIDFASHERSWFGNGIMLIPFDNCLGLQLMHNMCDTLADVELSTAEIVSAEGVIRRRVDRVGSNEWRDFQTKNHRWSSNVLEELGTTPEILVLPSSMYEVWGHPDWKTGWRDNFEAMEVLQSKIGVPWTKWVIRGHPIWAQRVGRNKGISAIRRYRNFCIERGIHFIEPDSKLHTSALIDAVDLVVLNGGSSVIEAVWKGKPVISLAESAYRFAGICPTLLGPNDTFEISDVGTRRRQLVRFIHMMDRVMPTYVNHLVSSSSAEQRQFAGADFNDIVEQIELRSLVTPNKNTSPVGIEVNTRPTVLQRARNLMRVGDI